MSQLSERIAQFRKMANDDPDNELGHYRLGQLLFDDKQYDLAVASFRRTLELSPQFSKVYQLLAQAQLAKAVTPLTEPQRAALIGTMTLLREIFAVDLAGGDDAGGADGPQEPK